MGGRREAGRPWRQAIMGNLGMGEILIIAVVALVLFGPKRIPEVAKALGKTVNAFKAGLREHYTEEKPAGEQPKGAAPEEVKKLPQDTNKNS